MTRPTTTPVVNQQQVQPPPPTSDDELITSIFIGRLSVSCTIQHLFALFNEYGDVHSVCIGEDDVPATFRNSSSAAEISTSERIAVAAIPSRTYAEQLVRSFDGHFFMGRFLR